MSYYRMGAKSESTGYLPFSDVRGGLDIIGMGMRQGDRSLYRTGIQPRSLVGDTGAMRWLQGFVMDIIHIVLLIAGGIMLLNAVS